MKIEICNFNENTIDLIKHMISTLMGDDHIVSIEKYRTTSDPMYIAEIHHVKRSINKDGDEVQTRMFINSVSLEYLAFILIPNLMGMRHVAICTDSIESAELHIGRIYSHFLMRYVTANNKKIEEICQKEEKEIDTTSNIPS